MRAMVAVLPFTAEQFFAVFERYNTAVWPAPIAGYFLGVVAVAAALRGGRAGAMIVAAVLASLWAWTGIAYHWLAFAPINQAAWLFGALFVVQAVALVWLGIVRGRLRFNNSRGQHSNIGLLLVAYAAFVYPLLGYAAGHRFPAMPMFGITPCPLTIFTLGLFLMARTVPWSLLVVPVLWTLIGGSAAFLLHVPQDWLLLVSGPLTVVLLWMRPRPAVR